MTRAALPLALLTGVLTLLGASDALAETRVLLTEVPPEDALSPQSARTLVRVGETARPATTHHARGATSRVQISRGERRPRHGGRHNGDAVAWAPRRCSPAHRPMGVRAVCDMAARRIVATVGLHSG